MKTTTRSRFAVSSTGHAAPTLTVPPLNHPVTTGSTTAAPWKSLLLAAAAWNIVGGATALADPARQFAQLFTTSLDLSDPLALFFYRCTWINVIAWGVAYAIAAFLPQARVPALVAGGAGKVFYFIACVAAFSDGAGRTGLVAAGAIDLLFVGLFIFVLTSHRPGSNKISS